MKKYLAFAMALFCTVSLVGCGGSTTEPTAENIEAAVEDSVEVVAEESNEIEPFVIVDHLGREVELTGDAQRIVSAYYITSSMLIALGVDEKVVGIETNPEKRPIYELAAPEFLELTSVGSAKEFDVEACLELHPDLVVLPIKLKETVEILESLGVTVLAVNPEDEELLKETMIMMGQAVGSEDLAESWISVYDEKRDALGEITSDIADKPTVYLGGNSSVLSTMGSKMYQNALIEMAGGTNVAAEISDTYWAEISYEQLIAYNPEVIVLASDAVYSTEDVMNDNMLQGIEAVKNEQVYQIPGNIEAWDSPVPSTILAAEWMCSILFAEEYSYEEMKESVYDFYDMFYGVEISKESLDMYQ